MYWEHDTPLTSWHPVADFMKKNNKKKYDKHFDKTFKNVLREQYDKLQQEKLFEERRILNEFASEWNAQYITHFYNKEGLRGSMIGFG